MVWNAALIFQCALQSPMSRTSMTLISRSPAKRPCHGGGSEANAPIRSTCAATRKLGEAMPQATWCPRLPPR